MVSQLPNITDEQYDEVIKFMKKSRGRALSKEEILNILLLHATTRKAKRQSVSKNISRLLHRKLILVQKIWSEYININTETVSKPPANTTVHATRFEHSRLVVSMVQSFVCECRKTRTCTVAKDVLCHLEENNIISVNRASTKNMQSALRAAQRFLRKLGYKRGKKRRSTYHLDGTKRILRDKYVTDMCLKTQAINPADRKTFVYLDESYTHHHYKRHGDSIFDPNDEQTFRSRKNIKVNHFVLLVQ